VAVVFRPFWHGCPLTDGQPSRSPSSRDRATAWLRGEAPSFKKELDEWIAPVQRRHRRIGKARGTTRACSFCGCKDLGPLVAGPGVWICGSCAQTTIEILRAEPRDLRAG